MSRSNSSAAYTLQASAATTNPTDGATVYVGNRPSAAPGGINNQKIYIPKSGFVRAVYLYFANTGTLGTSETATAAFFLNGTTATTISSAITNDSAQTTFNNSALSIAVAAGDYFEIRIVWPNWVTNPTNVFPSATILIES